MKEYFEINYKYTTAKRYSEAFESIKKEIGKYKLAYLTPYVLNQALLRIAQKVNSKDALRNYQKVTRSSLRDPAYYFGFIENNLAADLQLPRVYSFEVKNDVKHIYTQEEIDMILLRFKKNYIFTCAFLTTCYTGMRTGEVLALTWDDIDLEKQIIKVNKTVYAKKKDEIGDGIWERLKLKVVVEIFISVIL